MFANNHYDPKHSWHHRETLIWVILITIHIYQHFDFLTPPFQKIIPINNYLLFFTIMEKFFKCFIYK